MGKKINKEEGKSGIVFCIQPEQYEIFDDRINKPVCIKQVQNGIEQGSMVFQELDFINYRKNNLYYFPPNNVGLLLSIAKKSLNAAKEIYENHINPNKIDHSFVNTSNEKKKFLIEKSIVVADYIEQIQMSIVFGYTALEAFVNLSIPESYEYEIKNKNKGIKEVYNKNSIERWLSLNEKLSKILTKIFKTSPVENQLFWTYFDRLEKCRNDIIHQKSITRTEFYKKYFHSDIFQICKSPEEVLSFFYRKQESEKITNPLWPWLINKNKEFPLLFNIDSANLEVIGNLFEGIKR